MYPFLKKPFSVNYPMHYACMAQNHMGYLIEMEYYNYGMVTAAGSVSLQYCANEYLA